MAAGMPTLLLIEVELAHFLILQGERPKDSVTRHPALLVSRGLLSLGFRPVMPPFRFLPRVRNGSWYGCLESWNK